MKGTLFCRLFGHRFIQFVRHENKLSAQIQQFQQFKSIELPQDHWTSRESSQTCYRCGLSKEELRNL